MKKLTLIITIAVMSLNMAFAGNGNSIRNAISKQLTITTHLKTQKFNEKVNVQFKIDSDGKVSVMNVETSNTELKKYIVSQFNKIDFSSLKENKEAIYNISINFKVM